jgi:hypothetical protein
VAEHLEDLTLGYESVGCLPPDRRSPRRAGDRPLYSQRFKEFSDGVANAGHADDVVYTAP